MQSPLLEKSKRRDQREQRIQIDIVKFADMWPLPLRPDLVKRLPSPTTGSYLYHIPNGGYRSAAEAGRFKAMGVRAGMHDLHFLFPIFTASPRYPRPGYVPGLYIEVKDDDQAATYTPSQAAYKVFYEAMGYETAVARSTPDFKAIIELYLDAALPAALLSPWAKNGDVQDAEPKRP